MKTKSILTLAIVLTFLFTQNALCLVTNEIRVGQGGTDNDEYFELCGTGGESLDGLTYLVIGDVGGKSATSGIIDAVIDLSGDMPDDGFFLCAESTFSFTPFPRIPDLPLHAVDLTTNLNFENTGNVTHLLVSGFTGSLNDDLDTDDDGTLDSSPWNSVIDAIGLRDDVIDGVPPPYCYGEHLGFTDIGPDGWDVPYVYRYTTNDSCGGSWQMGNYHPMSDDTPGVPNIPEPATLLLLGLGGLALRLRSGQALRTKCRAK